MTIVAYSLFLCPFVLPRLFLARKGQKTTLSSRRHKMVNMAVVSAAGGCLLYSNKMKLHCFQLANNLNRILTFYYYFISMHTKAGGQQGHPRTTRCDRAGAKRQLPLPLPPIRIRLLANGCWGPSLGIFLNYKDFAKGLFGSSAASFPCAFS